MRSTSLAVRKDVYVPSFAPLRTISLVEPATAAMKNSLPEDLADYPSMMSADEKKLLYGLAKDHYLGEGIIVDAGIFLGASTRCFAAGLRVNPMLQAAKQRFGQPIVSFEMGVVNPGMPSFFLRNKVAIAEGIGQSFLPFLQENLASVKDIVDLRIGDIVETMVPLTSPVEILFLDVLKLPQICSAVTSHFFCSLIPNRSIVIQQDYFNELLEFIKTYQEAFGHFFEYLGEVQSSGVFLLRRKITPALFKKIAESISPEQQEVLATIALQRSIDPTRRFLMSVSKARMLAKTRGKDVALSYLEFVKADYPDQVVGGEKFKRRLGNVIDVAIAAIEGSSAKAPSKVK